MLPLHKQFFDLIIERENLERDYTSHNTDLIAQSNLLDNQWKALEEELGVAMSREQILAWQVQYWKAEENNTFRTLTGLNPNTIEGRWKILKQFIYCAYSLEPEYIYADGEASHTASLKSLTTLQQRWQNLEGLIGRKVSAAEVWAIESLDITSPDEESKYLTFFGTTPQTADNEGFTAKFVDILFQMSPENLWKDGEASRQEVEYKQQQLQKRWHDLEHQLGHSVSEDDVWAWQGSMQRQQAFMGADNQNLPQCPREFMPTKEILNAFLEVMALMGDHASLDLENYEEFLLSSWDAIEQQISYRVTQDDVIRWKTQFDKKAIAKPKLSRFSLTKENS